MRNGLAVLLLAASSPALAQKWVDGSGRVYYGTPPAGVHVQPAPMTGGTSSSVGSQPADPSFQPPRYVPVEPWQQQMRNREYERRRVEQARREREQRALDEAARKAGIERRREEERERRIFGKKSPRAY
jgi:hypothetical protein